MNYQALKSMIENLIKTYKCPECKSSVTEENIDIVGAAGANVNIDVECPKCKKHSMIKSQIIQMNINSIEGLRNSIQNIKNLKSSIKHGINDSEITNLSKDLKSEHINVSDLFEK
ncbi:MAG: hypothetical protein PHH06_02300 [Candidatus Gracilibacteria bacterium]|nr:hypothetical protein [Candidatus Gracilibacteria bacterium]